jgi:hypothetical protein
VTALLAGNEGNQVRAGQRSADAPRIGIDLKEIVRRYRVVTQPDDFYSLSPGSEALRPRQKLRSVA